MPISRMVKPLLIGEVNPYGPDPHFALYPAPDGCSGHRLCCLVLGMRRADYLREFERVNLCDGKWSIGAARSRANELCAHFQQIILLGAKVSKAFHMPFRPFEIVRLADAPDVELRGRVVAILPHPSGLCRMWNEEGAFERARAMVAEVVPGIAHLLGAGTEGDE